MSTPSAPDPHANPDPRNSARLTISCPDRPGIVAAVSRFLHTHGANIIHSDQHSTDPQGGSFFMRMEFHLAGLDLGRAAFEATFQTQVAAPFAMRWQVWYADMRRRMAIMVSQHDHCFLDLLWRQRRGDLEVDIPLVVSNHEALRRDAEMFSVPFHVVPVSKDTRAQAEDAALELLRGQADFVVLARYMQILSGDFLRRLGVPVINIHHSFLPAFIGANPYRAAHQRGVKLVGATAHYVTEELDAGPIIEQDVARVTHRETPETLMRLGRDVERQVLARAVRAHLEDRVLVYGNKTVVF